MKAVRFSISSPLNIRNWSFDSYNSCDLSLFWGFSTESGDFRCGGSGPCATLEDIAVGRFPIPDHFFGADNTANFQSVKQTIIDTAAQMLNEPKPQPPEQFPVETYVIYGYDYVHPKREFVPSTIDDSPIGRKLALVEELPQGPLMRLVRDMMAESYVIAKRGQDTLDKESPEALAAAERMRRLNQQIRNSLDSDLAAYIACNGARRLHDAIGEPFADGSREVSVIDTAPWHNYYPIDL